LERYHNVVDAPDNFNLDFDSVGSGETKPSKAAIQVNYLLEETTSSYFSEWLICQQLKLCADSYRGLVDFSLKLRFLLDIQISIFDLFHERLSDALGAYLARTTALGRASKEDQANLQGIAGLERLCRIYGSADYLVRAMRDWNYDEFFLQLWSDLHYRAAQKSSSHAPIAGGMTVAQIAARTSGAINASSNNSAAAAEPDVDDGALFDETAAAYERLRGKTEKIIAELLTNGVRMSLHSYTRINPWASLSSSTPTSTTAELDTLLQTLRALLGYLGRALGRVPLRRLATAVRHTLDDVLFNQVLLRHSFSGAGAAQFAVDLAAVESVLAALVANAGSLETGIARPRHAAILLGLPIRGKRGEVESEDDDDDDENGGEKKVNAIGLFEAGKKLYEGGGDEAGKLLEALGLTALTVADARKVLARRIELSS
jgi:hypothetical protein